MKILMITGSILLAGCAGIAAQQPDYAKEALQMLQADFKSKGPVAAERISQRDQVQQLCSSATAPSSEVASQLEKSELATVKYPQDGNWLGDFKKGEDIAQNGRGLQTSDKIGDINGGNCYACHQLSKREISFGNIGPSLYQYGKLRGNSEEVKRYTWAKLYNAQSYRACSVMPRFGHQGILTQGQLKDLMALLLDPASPVNQ